MEIYLGPYVGVGVWNIPMPSVRVNSSMSHVLGWGGISWNHVLWEVEGH